jgi:hypothetical protein
MSVPNGSSSLTTRPPTVQERQGLDSPRFTASPAKKNSLSNRHGTYCALSSSDARLATSTTRTQVDDSTAGTTASDKRSPCVRASTVKGVGVSVVIGKRPLAVPQLRLPMPAIIGCATWVEVAHQSMSVGRECVRVLSDGSGSVPLVRAARPSAAGGAEGSRVTRRMSLHHCRR